MSRDKKNRQPDDAIVRSADTVKKKRAHLGNCKFEGGEFLRGGERFCTSDFLLSGKTAREQKDLPRKIPISSTVSGYLNGVLTQADIQTDIFSRDNGDVITFLPAGVSFVLLLEVRLFLRDLAERFI